MSRILISLTGNKNTVDAFFVNILVPCQQYQDSRHLLQNQTVPNQDMGFSNRAQRFTGSYYLNIDSPLSKNPHYSIVT